MKETTKSKRISRRVSLIDGDKNWGKRKSRTTERKDFEPDEEVDQK